MAERSKSLDFESELEIAQVKILSALFIRAGASRDLGFDFCKLELIFFLKEQAVHSTAQRAGIVDRINVLGNLSAANVVPFAGEKDEVSLYARCATLCFSINQCDTQFASAGPGLKKGKVRVFHDLCPEYGAVAVVGLGKPGLGYNEQEEIHEDRESVRIAAAAGCRSLQDVEKTEIWVEGLGNPEAAAEGATLGLWLYQENKKQANQKKMPLVHCLELGENQDPWCCGIVKAESQNLARRLSDTPANLMTPTIFAKNAAEALTSHGVEVIAHDANWAQDHKMGSFLSVTRGSVEPPVFLEMSYKGGKSGDKPILLVGKGITFDSGGISIKPAGSMSDMRADMGGAACVVATLQAAAKLKLPINIVGLTPLCENMPSGSATKPGDVVVAMNGKTIQVDNTDAEGRLVLADALCYAAQFTPKFTLDIATLTGAMRIALGEAATGVFSNSTALWHQLHQAGALTGDRVWRFPLWDHYTKQMTDFPAADVNNLGKGKGGGSCTAAAFLKKAIVTVVTWWGFLVQPSTNVLEFCKPGAGLLTVGSTGTLSLGSCVIVIASTNDVADGDDKIIYEHLEGRLVNFLGSFSRVTVT
ncbi:bleomycin hydrolase [Homalodisca vitripennis]|nr:bleomycin hydrolase [Homalodisca vitripennis]